LLLTTFSDPESLTTELRLSRPVAALDAAIGGVVEGAIAAVAASLLANWFLVPPVHTFTIGDVENLVALVVFVAVAVTLGFFVDRTAARSQDARRARAEAEVLARSTAALLGEHEPVAQLVEQIRAVFSVQAVALLDHSDDTWKLVASSGGPVPVTPFDGTSWDLTVDPETVLVVRGERIRAEDQRLLRTFVDQLALALESKRLQAQADAALSMADADALRTALLQAVSHDLRTPLSSIKASVTSLLQDDVAWSPAERAEFLSTIDAEVDRLDGVVGNLLDMSRLQAGAVEVLNRPVFLEDVVANALASLGCGHDPRLVVKVPETLPAVHADPALLERAVANVVANAVSWSPPDEPVMVEGAVVGDRVHLRVIDRGPGVPLADRERVFLPFQRLGDRSNQAGVGLGLAVASGFIHAVGGRIELDDTPGRGLTVVIDLPAEIAA
jgi:two-component system sensor histidine kinase KdpD